MLPGDIPGVVALQRACFPEPFPEDQLWTADHLLAHLSRFAPGQFVALAGDQVIGSASNLILPEELWNAHLGWEETVGGFTFDNHDSSGTTLYGADISVHPEFRRQGIARHLYAARFSLVRSLQLNRYGTACRIPDFLASGLASPAEYCEQVVSGVRTDRTLTPLLAMGLSFVQLLPNYMPDPESGDCAALLEYSCQNII